MAGCMNRVRFLQFPQSVRGSSINIDFRFIKLRYLGTFFHSVYKPNLRVFLSDSSDP